MAELCGDPVCAADLTPGTAVDGGPFWEHPGDPDVIDVAWVEQLGGGMAQIHDVDGRSWVTCGDMAMTIVTGGLADLIGAVVLSERERHRGERP